MTAVQLAVRNFEGQPLTTYIIDGRPSWLAADIGKALGYDDTSQVAKNIRRRWTAEFIEGTDFVSASPRVLRAFREASCQFGTGESTGGRATTSQTLLIYESGVNLVCIRSRTKSAMAFRRWLASDVLPSIRATGRYAVPDADHRTESAPEWMTFARERMAFARYAIAQMGADLDPATKAEWLAAAMAISTGSQNGNLSKNHSASGPTRPLLAPRHQFMPDALDVLLCHWRDADHETSLATTPFRGSNGEIIGFEGTHAEIYGDIIIAMDDRGRRAEFMSKVPSSSVFSSWAAHLSGHWTKTRVKDRSPRRYRYQTTNLPLSTRAG